MWNFSSIAQKAKEAAARIESQLDDSVGIKEDGSIAATLPTSTGAALTAHDDHDDLNVDEEDDFFSDNHHNFPQQQHSQHSHEQPQQPQQRSQIHSNNEETSQLMRKESSLVATKIEVSTCEENDFFGEDEQDLEQIEQQVAGLSNDEALDKDCDEVNGWDEGDDIASLDDEEHIVLEQHQIESKDRTDSSEEPDRVEEQLMSLDTRDKDQLSDAPPNASSSGNSRGIVRPSDPNQGLTDESLVRQHDLAASISRSEADSMETQSFKDKTASEARRDHSDVDMEERKSRGFTDDNMQGGVIARQTRAFDTTTSNESTDAASQTTTIPGMGAHSSSPLDTANPTALNEAERQKLLDTISQLESQRDQREQQLKSKAVQLTSITLHHETETARLRKLVTDTKEEAKKRILKAKERVEEMQTKLAEAVRRADAAGGDNQEQSQIIAALRAEGEQLARKQNQMEQLVRNASGESRELAEQLESEKEGREAALAKVELLEREIKALKDELTLARKRESQCKKLEGELVASKEEYEKQRAINLGLEQQVKELKEENKALLKEVQDAKKGAALESERESNKLRKERDEMLSDLENKLRTSEREANVREDALRHEVYELRKRWQDAVRRAEDLSMDVQSNTAPLLRQLESVERQSRVRASAWAELESKLRSDLEEHVVQSEKLAKERNDLRANEKRLQRLLKEKESEVVVSQETIDALSLTIGTLEAKIDSLEEEGRKMKEDWIQVERQASEGIAKVRSDMMKSVVDSEERYQSQIDALEEELEVERQRRNNLEKELDTLAESVKAAEFARSIDCIDNLPDTEKKLGTTTNQASILHDTLVGIDSDADDDVNHDDEMDLPQKNGCFAAMEQLSLGLKGAKLELEALRKQLASSEETRESLLAELGDARLAAEKIPLFEAKVSELTMDVRLKEMEIQGLRDDIADVRFLYRTQLDTLLEEKTAAPFSDEPSPVFEAKPSD